VSSGSGTLSWTLFLPFSIGFGALTHIHGVNTAGWIFVGTCAALAALLVISIPASRSTATRLAEMSNRRGELEPGTAVGGALAGHA
jgi:hypothetical protein